MQTRLIRLSAALIFSACAFLFAENPGNPAPPLPTPLPPPIAAPVDKPYPGVLQLGVELADLAERVVHVRETIPIQPGAKQLVLLYPEWIPGHHSPTGPIARVAGIVTSVDGRRVQWVRDPVNVFALHVPLAPGTKSVELQFDYLSPNRQAEGRIEISDAIADLEWNELLMYPAGYFTRQIPFDVTLKLPDGWKCATALETESEQGSTLKFKRTTLNTLVDSPVYAGAYFKRIDISPAPSNVVHLDLFADEEKDLAITAEQLQKHKQLATEAAKLYGSHHYEHYDLMLLLSDKVGGIGLEHHQSSENGEPAKYLTDWDTGVLDRDLLPHEYTHSWNGKFRRPADLWTPNFNVPMRDDLLWVYEGMTQYWGTVLAARSGLRTPEETRTIFAQIASGFESMPGRSWRPLVDTTNQPTISQRQPVSFPSWQLPENYYDEGALVWLDADTKIRELTNGQKSLDDFAKAFFGIYNGSFVTVTYTLEDVVKTLNSVAPYDWATFLRERVYDLHPAVPQDGITRGGYRLVYTDNEQPWVTKAEAADGRSNFTTSLGFTVLIPKDNAVSIDDSGPTGALSGIVWNGPAFKAGVTPDMQLISVNGKEFTPELLRDAILAAEKTRQPIQLQFKRGNNYLAIPLAYFGGLRIPSLQRVEGAPDRLNEILAPSKNQLPAM